MPASATELPASIGRPLRLSSGHGPRATIGGMDLAIDRRPARTHAEQLLLLLHGEGGAGEDMLPLADALCGAFPNAAVLAPQSPHELSTGGRGWLAPYTAADGWVGAVNDLRPWVRSMQRELRVGLAATAIGGLGQGATLALELIQSDDGLAGRVLAFGGLHARSPDHAPRLTTLHLLGGQVDPTLPPEHLRHALQHLAVLHGDATLDLAEGVGAGLHPALIDCALHRLRNHIPHRTWQAALGAAPGRSPD